MFSSELSTFLLSWRGFLLEGRRNWHAHHHRGVVGVRAGYLLAQPVHQQQQLFRAAQLIHTYFQRGATAWGFGLTQQRRCPLWGRLWVKWRPGVVSNYFFIRVRRVHFARRVALVLRLRHRGVHSGRRLRHRLACRWRRLRQVGRLPGQAYRTSVRAGRLQGYAAAAVRLARAAAAFTPFQPGNWRVTPAWSASPRVARFRVAYFRQWWRQTHQYVNAVRAPRSPRWWRPAGAHGLKKQVVKTLFARAVTRRGRRQTARVTVPRWSTWSTIPGRRPRWWTASLTHAYRRGAAPRGDRPRGVPVVAARYTGWPTKFPGLICAGGLTLLGSNLVHEAHGTGLALVHFGPTGFTPVATVWQVTWNQDPTSLYGVTHLLHGLWGVAQRAGLFRLLWRRLCV